MPVDLHCGFPQAGSYHTYHQSPLHHRAPQVIQPMWQGSGTAAWPASKVAAFCVIQSIGKSDIPRGGICCIEN